MRLVDKLDKHGDVILISFFCMLFMTIGLVSGRVSAKAHYERLMAQERERATAKLVHCQSELATFQAILKQLVEGSNAK